MTPGYRKTIRVLGVGEGVLELEKLLSRETDPSFEVIGFPRVPKPEEAALFDAAFIDHDRLGDWKPNAKVPVIAFCADPKTASDAFRRGAVDAALPADFEPRILRRILLDAVERRARDEQTARMAGMNLDFLFFVAHEIRGPLAIVKEGVTLVGDKILGKINQKQEKVLQTSKKNIDRIDRLISSMLDISKLESGRMELRKEEFDAMALVKDVVEPYAALAAEKNVEFRVRSSGESVRVLADRARVREVFEILLSNAFKFTEKGSVEFDLALAKGELTAVVRDTGVGIEKEDLTKIFSKFSQIGWAPGGGQKGMGVGLAIARGIAGLHGGSIEVISAPGKGSTFTLRIPARAGKGAHA